jgi:uncharacterized protein involved in type VI secretion and phage assembly
MIRLGFILDTADPEQRGRVKIEFLGHEAGAESDWAPVATPLAGDETGLFLMPEAGDMVAVGFVNGDLNQPIMLGALWNGTQKAPADDAKERRFVSRSGHFITLSDGDDDGITIEDTHKNRIVMNADGISIETDKDLTIKVGGKTSFETSGEATIVGSQIKLNP